MVNNLKLIKIIILLIILFPLNIYAFYDTAKSTVVVDMNSGRVLYQKNPNEKRLIASTTKIMTAIITLENIDINKKVTVGEEVLKMYGTNIYVEVGEKIKIKDLLYGLLLRSGNDAAVVLANNVSRSEKEFINLMNEKAKKLKMTKTHFENPHGLDEETKNVSTASDMAKLSKYAYQNKIFRQIVKTKKYETNTKNKTYFWYNRNKLLIMYKYATGGKNGYTPAAGKTLVTTANKENFPVTVVTLKDNNPYENHKNIYEYIYNKYKNYTIVDKNNFNINKEFYKEKVYIKRSVTYPLKDNEIDKIKTKIILPNNKINNNIVGHINIYLDNKLVKRENIYKKKKNKSS